jgi:hypothetical protein
MDRKRFKRGPLDVGRSLLITGFFLLATRIAGQALRLDGPAATRFSVLYLAGLQLTLAALTLAAFMLRCRACPLVQERSPFVIEFKALFRDIHKTKADDRVGAYWQSLTDSDIAAFRRPEDGFGDYLRVHVSITSHRACPPVVFRNH